MPDTASAARQKKATRCSQTPEDEEATAKTEVDINKDLNMAIRTIFLFLLLFMHIGACGKNYETQQQEWLPFGTGIPVLLYHGLLEKADRTRIYDISIKEFRSHLAALKEAGYTTVGVQDLLDYFQQKRKIPKKSIMITFDDGRKDSFYLSDSILKEFGFQAVMFIIASMQDKQYPLYLTWEELNLMYHSGRWDIQAHGYQYHDLIQIDERGTRGNFASNLKWLTKEKRLETTEEYEQRLVNDLIKQKRIIENHIPGNKVIAFAYPFGDWGSSAENIDHTLAEAVNYIAVGQVFSMSFGTVVFQPEEYRIVTTPHLIMRFMDNERFSPEQLVQIIQNFQM